MMSDARHFIVATAGHVDHGKSALVKALTGTDPDRLPEEKARGITIDLGFAHLELQSPAPPHPTFHLGIVDVPGHEDFVKNMVAGVGSIDLALLVVAADDGWMPQTEEHLQILNYLGVTHAVVALTKIDLAQDEQNSIAAIRDKLRDTPFADAPILPTSVFTGRGLNELRSALAEVVSKTPEPRDIGKPRLPVDRVFHLQGIGTVVTGTLTGGIFRRGQNVIVQPSATPARVRSIQSHNRNMEFAGPGTRTALNLPNLVSGEDIHRGDVITLPEFGDPSETLDVLLEISPRATRPVKDGARVWIHHGSSSVAANVAFYSGKKLDVGEKSPAQLRLDTPSFVFTGDRFVVRDWAGQNTLAGGRVFDAEPNVAPFKSDKRLRFLAQREEAGDNVQSHILSQLARDGTVRISQLLLKSRFSGAEIRAAISASAAARKIISVGDFVADTAAWNNLRSRAVNAIEALHHAHPERIGIPLSELQAQVRADLPFAALFDELIEDLCDSSQQEFVHAGALIRRATHQPALPAHLRIAGAKIRATLAGNPFDPPSRKELAPDAASQQALRFLIEIDEVVEVNSEVVMTQAAKSEATNRICDFIRRNGPATTSDLRQAVGSSRRVIIPLLEGLDRAGITERTEDRRRLRKN